MPRMGMARSVGFLREFNWIALGALIASIASIVAMSVHAQERAEVRTLDSVYVTGSNIRRVDVETALPLEVLTREDIARSGATSVFELLRMVPANLAPNTDAVFAPSLTTSRFPSVNLRGLGEGSTLVLVNGRRLASFAANTGAVDLNFIPLAAIDRIEILKDGASAIYGSDAIAGVVNFILAQDYRGFEVSAYGNLTEHGGGNQQRATMAAGHGDLQRDGFNVFAVASYQNSEALAARDRSFSRTAYRPDETVPALNRETFPANINAGAGVFLNPTAQVGCLPPVTLPLPGSLACGHDSNAVMNVLPPVERTNLLAGVTWRIGDHVVRANYLYAHNSQQWIRNQVPSSQTFNSDHRALLYPSGGPFYPAGFAAEHGLSGDLNLFYRAIPLGPIVDEDRTDAHHAVVSMQGAVAGWDYDAALVHSEDTEHYIGLRGRVSEARLLTAMAGGLVNPFGPSGIEGDALLAAAQAPGEVFHFTAKTDALEAKTSRAVAALPGGPLWLAVGAEARREKFANIYSTEQTSGDILGSTTAPLGVGSGSRTVEAVFAEATVPLSNVLEWQLAARYDHYSDFGGSLNPKVALRWTPLQSTLVRASYGTGFRAPTLLDLYTPVVTRSTGRVRDDPSRCPTTRLPSDCDVAFDVSVGGNPDLQPETSRQLNAGIVWEMNSRLSAAVDYWRIDKKRTIGSLTDDLLFRLFDQFSPTNVARGPPDGSFPALPGPILHLFEGRQNLGKLQASGVDVDAVARTADAGPSQVQLAFNGTYVAQWKQQLDGVTWTSAVGRAVVGPIPRWRHRVVLGFTAGSWSATLAQTFQSGYTDANLNVAGAERRVAAYDSWDTQVTYALRDASVALGVLNLFDRAPPLTNQATVGQLWYDPRYADPRGRVFYAQLTYVVR